MDAKEITHKRAKICLFGEVGVGKTSLIRRFVENIFDDKYITTIGTKVTKKVILVKDKIQGKTVGFTLMIWDIMGQKSFRPLLQEAYFDGANVALGVCDLTNRETYESIEKWVEVIWKAAGKIPIVLLGNKSDLESRAVGEEELKNMVTNFYDTPELNEKLRKLLAGGSKPYMLTSAKTGENVEKAFQTVAEVLL